MSKSSGFNNFIRNSATFKLLVVAVLGLILLIPANLVDSLIYERQNLRDQAVNQIASTWGGPQRLAGPVLQVPYAQVYPAITENDVSVTKTGSAYFLPDEVTIDGNTISEERYRGIYVAVLYTGDLQVSGKFERLSIDRLDVSAASLDWSKARLTFGVEDLRGIDSLSKLSFADQRVDFEPGTPSAALISTGFQAPIQVNESATDIEFSFSLSVRGSSSMSFMPLAATTDVKLQSDWDTPKFSGTFLPDERSIDASGFSASWHVLEVNRPFAQEGTMVSNQIGIRPLTLNRNSMNSRYETYPEPPMASTRVDVNGSDFGVDYLLPVDEYRKIMRSAKYSTLFIAATFLTFFFIEVLNRKRLHPVQYLLVGFAIVLFYILLLSLSEHIGFDAAYGLCVVLILGLVTGYSYAVLRNIKLTALVAGVLGVLYGFFYSLLQLEDLSLLIGSLGLLVALGTIMYLTRQTDWYNLSTGDDADDDESSIA